MGPPHGEVITRDERNGQEIHRFIGQHSFVRDMMIPGRRARIWDDHSKSWYPPQSRRVPFLMTPAQHREWARILHSKGKPERPSGRVCMSWASSSSVLSDGAFANGATPT
jgi:hypothetical protein